MGNNFIQRLSDFYYENGIHPLNFNCRHEEECKSHAYNGVMTEAKMSMVGNEYGTKYPRIVVVSLDPPSGNNGPFTESEHRTTEYITKTHEKDNYSINRPNPHWAMTQIIVKDILLLWGYESIPNASVVKESYAGRPIDNVSRFFAHVNIAKCSMNNPYRGQAHKKVLENCGNSYLINELSILTPDILILQGEDANILFCKLICKEFINNLELPSAKVLMLNDKRFLWLPMIHPTRNIDTTRSQWGFYINKILEYKKNIY